MLQRTGIIEISINQMQSRPVLVRIFVNVINSSGIEGAGTPDNSVDCVALAQKQLREIRTVLSGNTRN